MKIFKWIAGFFEDENGKASRTGAVTYIALLYLGFMVNKQVIIDSYRPDEMLLFTVASIILFGIGAINKKVISDIFSKQVKKE